MADEAPTVEEQTERAENQRRASEQLDAEQVRRIAEAAEAEAAEAAAREESRQLANAAMDSEQARRVSVEQQEEATAEAERKLNQQRAVTEAEEERQRRMSSRVEINEEAKTALSELHAGIGDMHLAPDDAETGEGGGGGIDETGPPIAPNASGNPADLMNLDAEDEALQKYKQELLGAAATGEVGDPNDPRRVILEEFRLVFNEEGRDPIIFTPPAGDDYPTEFDIPDKFTIKEGSEYRFQFTVRVQHEIVNILKFQNTGKKGILPGVTDTFTVGSLPPGSHNPTVPHNQWCVAPTGSMGRGNFKGTAKLIDADGNLHVTVKYKFENRKTW
jgi:hypothetical protein